MKDFLKPQTQQEPIKQDRKSGHKSYRRLPRGNFGEIRPFCGIYGALSADRWASGSSAFRFSLGLKQLARM